MCRVDELTRTVFLDRDGVLNRNRSDHVKVWSEFEFLPGALAAVARLTNAGYRVVVVTNQAIVGRGGLSQPELDAIHGRMTTDVERAGGRIAAVLACLHRPEAGCGCRKPAPGLLHAAVNQHAVDLDQAVLIGDHLTDLEAARRAGCPSILVLSGRTTAWPTVQLPAGCLAVRADVGSAVDYVLEHAAAIFRRRPNWGDVPVGVAG